MTEAAKPIPTRALKTKEVEEKPGTPVQHVEWATDEEWARIVAALRHNGL